MEVFALLAFAAASPVWIASQTNGGLMLSWDKRQVQSVELVVQAGTRETLYPLERATGTMILSTPAPPYRIGYRVGNGESVTLASSGVLPAVEPQPSAARLAFQSRGERISLAAPVSPPHLREALRRQRKEVDLYIKVNRSGKVTATSSPYYTDPVRRELAGVASDIAMKEWRFRPPKGQPYRDGRIRLSFDGNGARIRSYVN